MWVSRRIGSLESPLPCGNCKVSRPRGEETPPLSQDMGSSALAQAPPDTTLVSQTREVDAVLTPARE